MTSEMARTVLVTRDAAGTIINFGPWDYQPQARPILAKGGEPIPLFDEAGGPRLDAAGNELFTGAEPGQIIGWDASDPIIRNPMPEGATQAEEDVIVAADGSPVLASDYARLRRASYPPIAEQLDALWKGGKAATAMRKTIAAVKAAHPKPL